MCALPIYLIERRSALFDRHIVALRRAGVELARATDLLRGVGDHLVPLRDPADGAGEREQHGEHLGREADGRQDHARIEVDVRIELSLDEIRIVRSEEHTPEIQTIMRITYAGDSWN